MKEDTKLFGIEKSLILFNTAKDFFEKGINATKEAHSRQITIAKHDPSKLVFPITCLSFALELALKCFLGNRKFKGMNGHRLHLLYSFVDSAIQSEIEDHFENCSAHNWDFFNYVIQPPNRSDPVRKNTQNAKETINEMLKRCNDPYYQFRYLHEFKKDKILFFDFNHIIKLTHSCLAIQAKKLNIEL